MNSLHLLQTFYITWGVSLDRFWYFCRKRDIQNLIVVMFFAHILKFAKAKNVIHASFTFHCNTYVSLVLVVILPCQSHICKLFLIWFFAADDGLASGSSEPMTFLGAGLCHVSSVTCHLSCVMCHVSHVTCHISGEKMKRKKNGKNGGASRSTVCYQRGLTRLVS